jgi:alpha-amylase/alpha-mannosidase (GH57 family)
VRAVVNLVPVLLDQLEDYAQQCASGQLRDPLLKALTHEDLDRLTRPERERLLDQCFRANHTKMIEPFAPFKRLRDLFEFTQAHGGEAGRYLSGQYFADLVTWYHLVWTGETVRRTHEPVVRLMSQGEGFSYAQRMELFQLIATVLREIVARYRKLAESGRVELSSTPHYHPIGPLLLDFACAREALPDAPLPEAQCYPGGRSRLGWHLAHAMDSHGRRFGAPPAGIWPAEGAVSMSFARLLAQSGVRWIASGEGVLANSLGKSKRPTEERGNYLYRPYRLDDGPTCFFRDERLSDLIGFEYKSWHGADAASHFIAQLEQILAAAPAGEEPVVSVMLDGENAWEYYPYNAYYFLHDLYGALETHPHIRTATCSEVLARGAAAPALPQLVAGSWVYGNLSTWIGSPDKNRAWDLLAKVKHSYDLVTASGRLSAEEAEAASRQLAVCEGSDWFWWFGDYNPHDSVAAFDRLFRDNLARLYHLLKLTPPRELDEPVSRGAVDAHTTGAMRRAA